MADPTRRDASVPDPFALPEGMWSGYVNCPACIDSGVREGNAMAIIHGYAPGIDSLRLSHITEDRRPTPVQVIRVDQNNNSVELSRRTRTQPSTEIDLGTGESFECRKDHRFHLDGYELRTYLHELGRAVAKGKPGLAVRSGTRILGPLKT